MKNVISKSFLISCLFVYCLYATVQEVVDGAMVIPIFKEQGRLKVLLAEENTPGYYFCGTMDGFGGSFDAQEDQSGIDTAAREFWEEAILAQTLGWSVQDTKEYLQAGAVRAVIKTFNWPKLFPRKEWIVPNAICCYITHFTTAHIDCIKERFFDALNMYLSNPTPENARFCEKGNLAVVDWEAFVLAVRTPNLKEGSQVKAVVYDMHRKELPQERDIVLRSGLVGALHKHFLAYPILISDGRTYEYDYADTGK